MIDKIIKKEIQTIGRHKYEALKNSLSKLNLESDRELDDFIELHKMTVGKANKEVEKYENKHKYLQNNSLSEKSKEYLRNIGKEKEVSKTTMTKDWLYIEFEKEYRIQNNVKYSREANSIENIKPLIYYFVGDYDNFIKCKNVSLKSKPSIDKGLLIIGGYGVGKTSIMKTLETVFRKSNISFVTYSTNEIVTKYESCENSIQKNQLMYDLNNGTRYFDDVLTERIANNYGKANIMREIFEARDFNNKRTYVTMNFDDKYKNDVDKALEQIGIKYGSRVYDRVFKMYNIIVFTGNSHRV